MRLFLLVTFVLAGPAFAAEPAQPDTALLRTALVVSDVELSKRFYSKGLGYRIGFDGDITRPAVRQMLQLSDSQTAHFVVLRGADSIAGEPVSSAMLGLLKIAGPSVGDLDHDKDHSLKNGQVILAIVTADIEAVYERLLMLDAEVLYAPTIAADGSEIELVVNDPDGIRIHVVQSLR